MSLILFINTADEKKVFLGLIKKDKFIAQKVFFARYRQAEKLLVELHRFLQAANCKLKNLKALAVIAGPGPFTALRIGITTANTLGWSLKLPVVGIKLNEFENTDELIKVINQKLKKVRVGQTVEPFYGREPRITIKND